MESQDTIRVSIMIQDLEVKVFAPNALQTSFTFFFSSFIHGNLFSFLYNTIQVLDLFFILGFLRRLSFCIIKESFGVLDNLL